MGGRVGWLCRRFVQVRMLYVGRLHNGTRPEVRHMRDARLEAGRLQRMRHARARLEIVVVSIEAVLRLLPVRLEIGVVVRVEVGEVAAVPASSVPVGRLAAEPFAL